MTSGECGDRRAWSSPGFPDDVEAVCTRRAGHDAMAGAWPPPRENDHYDRETGIWWDGDGEHRTDDHEPDERPWR